jgi:tagatose 6-phosphate kinase
LFLTVCLNPTIQKTYLLSELKTEDVNRASRSSLDISGKGINVTRVLHGLGEKAVHLTHAGGKFASFFLERAKEEKLRLSVVRTRAEIRLCVTLVNARRPQVMEIVEDGFAVDGKTESKILRAYSRLLPKCRAVVISGTKAPGYSDGLFPEMIRLARKAGAFCVADYRGEELLRSLPHRPDVIKPNLSEFIETFFPALDSDRRDAEMAGLVERTLLTLAAEQKTMSIITDGARPVVYTDGGSLKRFAPPARETLNTTGCGDAFAAGFVSRFLRSRDIDEAVRFGDECAGRNAAQLRPGFIG